MEHNPIAHNGELILIPEHCEEHKQTSTQRRLVGAQLIDVHESFMVRSMEQEREREGRKIDGRLKKHGKGAAGEHGNRTLTCYLLISSNQCCTAPCQFREP